jgi:hypothetical protein
MSSLIIAIILFISFSIGVNLGMHGVLNGAAIYIDKTHASNPQTGDRNVSPNAILSNVERLDGQGLLLSSQRAPNTKHVTNQITVTTNSEILTTELFSNVIQSESIIQPEHIQHHFAPSKVIPVTNSIFSKIQGIRHDSSTKMTKIPETNGEIFNYVKSGKKFPIVLLTCNRPQLLQETLKNLMAVKNVDKADILISQDGAMKEIKDIVDALGIRLIQNTEGIRLRGGVAEDGSVRIAKHYKYSLSQAFNIFPNAPAIVIVEDDLLFSPDFYDYMHSNAAVLEIDKSTFLLSAWNDNGFKGKVREPYSLLRTEFFPGLGWLLPKALYKQELERKWPQQHWDHWLRSYDTNKGREIVYPQVRTVH